MAGPERYNQFDQGDRGISQAPEQRFEAPELNNQALLTGIQTENAKWPTFGRAYEMTGMIAPTQVLGDGSILLAGWRPNNGAVELSFDQALKIAGDSNGNGHHAPLTDVVALNPLDIRPEEWRGNPDLSGIPTFKPSVSETGESTVTIGGKTFNAADVIATNPDGTSDRTLLAQATDKQKPLKETDPNYMPAVSEQKILSVAEKLGEDKTRWRTDSPPHGPKCNIYVDAAMKNAGLPRPWAETGVQSCEIMDAQFAKDPRYDQAWHTDYSNVPLSRQNWQYFNQHAGDIFVWNTPEGIIHSGIADGKGGLHYAGSARSKTGYAHTKVEYYTGTPERPMDYGPPTSVYRYKNLKD